jgi:transcriptional regulatory protein LEU3
MRPQAPVTKFDPSLVNPQLHPDLSVMSFDTWDGSQYDVPPMTDQFPDYDWAAGFEFSNSEFPTLSVGPINPMMPGPGQGAASNMQFAYS